MAITGSPAVIVKEQDLSSFVSAVSATTGAVVGDFEWGPAESITKITSEGNLVQYFGYPHDWNYKDWFTAKNYLQYSSSLAVVRCVNEFALNATDSGVGFLIENDSKFIEKVVSIPHDIKIVARYPGNMGNTLRVCVLNKAGLDEQLNAIKDAKKSIENGVYIYTTTDGTEITVNKALNYIPNLRSIGKNEVVVVVLRANSDGTEDILEYGTYSTIDGSTDTSGYTNYLFKHFNNNSNWIYLIEKNWDLYNVVDIDCVLGGGVTPDMNSEVYLDKKIGIHTAEGGDWINYDRYPTTSTELKDESNRDFDIFRKQIITELANENRSAIYNAWDLFRNEETEESQVQLLMQGGGDREVGEYIIQLAETRKDCLACVSPEMEEVVNKKSADAVATIISRNGTGSYYSGSSYAFMDGNYKYQYDNYNDVYRWMPLNGDIAGIMAQIDNEEEPWISPGGRVIKNCVKLAYHPTKAERDDLFAANVNPVTNFRAEGNILYGDWTRVSNTSFNFIGVRRLFLYIERAIKEYARKIMWKQNDEITETLFLQTVEPFLLDVQGGRGIQEFKVLAGSAVTSPDEMDRGIFRAKILIKPVRSIRYVELVFTSVRSDMNIEEIV
jgi:hypothetical protein